MVSNCHYIELFINKEQIELKDQKSLNIRLNNKLFDPTTVATNQSEYSYSFEIPSTPNNDKVLDYANNLSKLNKFHARYDCQVYGDGDLIFDGSLTIRSYNAKDKMYTCNLVSIKVNDLDEIFGDAVLTDVPWMVDFDGVTTINTVNADPSTKYWFPLMSYGVFPKDPLVVDAYGVQNDYSSKFVIDNTNRFYISSFYPSLNVLEELKKCFEWKGYKVGGTAFNDPVLGNIYTSTNLTDEQDPTYNVGNQKFGKLKMEISWSGSSTLPTSSSTTPASAITWFQQDLKFPYFRIGGGDVDLNTGYQEQAKWNLSEVFINPILREGTITTSADTTMWMPRRASVVIPADGFYKVTLTATTDLLQTNKITAKQWIRTWNDDTEAMNLKAVEGYPEFTPDLKISTPIEIQLVRNYDENLELIKGKRNIAVNDGNPDHLTECNVGRYSNFQNYTTCYPHEALGGGAQSWLQVPPTKTDPIADSTTRKADCAVGYVYKDDTPMCYDKVVSPIFIAGCTTMGNKEGGGCCAFLKDGRSWSSTVTAAEEAFYLQNGYDKIDIDAAWQTSVSSSNLNKNDLPNIPNCQHVQFTTWSMDRVRGMVYLKKGDILELFAVRRGYWGTDGNPVSYDCKATIGLTIEAASPRNKSYLQQHGYKWTDGTEFPTQLNLMNFTNKETKVSDWIKSITDAFNLSLEMKRDSIEINLNKGFKKNIKEAVSIDDRTQDSEATSEYISYPKQMAVKFKIDTDEHGFYESVPQGKLNLEDWKNYGDSGYTIIKLNDDAYETSKSEKSLQYSYTWYDVWNVAGSFTNLPLNHPKRNVVIPTIAKEDWMIDTSYNYEDDAAKRGYSLAQRFVFRDFNFWGTDVLDIGFPIEDDTYLSGSTYHKRSVTVYCPRNQYLGVNLSFKDTEKSLLTEYQNVYPMLSSNYVKLGVYLTPAEYRDLKNGALCHYDSDLYYVSEIQGFDPSGNEPTTLKLVKKV